MSTYLKFEEWQVFENLDDSKFYTYLIHKGNKSKQKEKKSISATNIIDPGNPKNISKLSKLIKNSLGHKKFKPLISVTKRVLKRRPIASTCKNELVERSA